MPAATVASVAMTRVGERRDMLEDYALPTHSSVPLVNRWCFQTGTAALSSSVSARQGWVAHPGSPRVQEVHPVPLARESP